MSDFEFSKRTVNLLMFAGWRPGRRVDISKYEHSLERNGLEIFPVVRDFLEEFYGLRVVWPINAEHGILEALRFDITNTFTQEDLDEYVQRIGRSVRTIGWIERDPHEILMDSDGKVYIAQMGYLALINESGAEAVENLLSRGLFHFGG